MHCYAQTSGPLFRRLLPEIFQRTRIAQLHANTQRGDVNLLERLFSWMPTALLLQPTCPGPKVLLRHRVHANSC